MDEMQIQVTLIKHERDRHDSRANKAKEKCLAYEGQISRLQETAEEFVCIFYDCFDRLF